MIDRDDSPRERRPLVSVIVPAHNAEAHIRHTLKSALAQTYADIEVIVIDDESTDSTVEIVREFARRDERVRLLQQSNQGVAAARNHGLAHARGEYIAPLDADDLWDPRKLELQVRRMEECGPDTALVYCWWVWMDEDGEVLDASPQWKIEGRVIDCLIEVNFTGCASVPLYRRDCLLAGGGYTPGLRDQKATHCEDWEVALQTASRYQVAVTPALLVAYRRRTHSMSTDCAAMWRSHRSILESLRARRHDVSPSLVRRSRGQLAMHLAGVCFWTGRYGQALFWMLRSRRPLLVLGVLPHLARMLLRRALFPHRWRYNVIASGGRLDAASILPAIIPYDRLLGSRLAGEPLRPARLSAADADTRREPVGGGEGTASSRRPAHYP